MMMEILDAVGIRLHCPACGRAYEVPLRDVLMSHAMIRHGGCPVRQDTECPPLAQIFLFDNEEVLALQRAWEGLQQRAGKDGGELVLMNASEADSAHQRTA